MTQRKQFDYKNSNAYDIADHFYVSTRQAVDSVRKFWKKDDVMTSKLNAAYYLCKLQELKATLNEEYHDFLDLC